MIPNHPFTLGLWLDRQRMAAEIGRGHTFDVAKEIATRPGLQGESDGFFGSPRKPGPDLGRAVVESDRVLRGSRPARCRQQKQRHKRWKAQGRPPRIQ